MQLNKLFWGALMKLKSWIVLIMSNQPCNGLCPNLCKCLRQIKTKDVMNYKFIYLFLYMYLNLLVII